MCLFTELYLQSKKELALEKMARDRQAAGARSSKRKSRLDEHVSESESAASSEDSEEEAAEDGAGSASECLHLCVCVRVFADCC